jgi:hypothetical protein
MVLKYGLIVLFLFCRLGVAASTFSSKAYDQALALHKKKQDSKAIEVLHKAYNLNSIDNPPKVASLAAALWLREGNPEKSMSVADGRLKAGLPWWGAYLTDDFEEVKIADKMKNTQKSYLPLMTLAGEARSQYFKNNFERMTPKQRADLKSQTQRIFDAVSVGEGNMERAQKFVDAVSAEEDLGRKRIYSHKWLVQLAYVTWLDKVKLFDNTEGQDTGAVIQTPCFGPGWSRGNFFNDISFGACAGIGTSHVRFKDNSFDAKGKSSIMMMNSRYLRKTTENGSGLGVEVDAGYRAISAKTSDGVRNFGEGSFFGAALVGRIQISKVSVDLKLGGWLNHPSGVWSIELGIPVY